MVYVNTALLHQNIHSIGSYCSVTERNCKFSLNSPVWNKGKSTFPCIINSLVKCLMTVLDKIENSTVHPVLCMIARAVGVMWWGAGTLCSHACSRVL